MTPPRSSSGPANPAALFLSPEEPKIGSGGGGLRSASLLEYMRRTYAVQPVTFTLKPHSKTAGARIWRNTLRIARGRPPLFDRFSGYEAQLAAALRGRFAVGVVEHFWCASYADLLRTCCDRLVLDLHNIESQLARTHARAARWPASWASQCFAKSYDRLERDWLPKFDVILTASEDDRRRLSHPDVRVFPNALPDIPRPAVSREAVEAPAIAFSGNLEYHPNVEAVRWFRQEIWPRVRQHAPGIEWRLIGTNPAGIAALVAGDPRIRVVGPVEDAVAHLAEAQVCIVPLLSGSGTRFKILEAWAAERAVVSTTLGAEGLDASNGAHLLLADDASQFADAVLRLLNDPALRQRLGDAGWAHYQDRFTWPAAWRVLDESGGI